MVVTNMKYEHEPYKCFITITIVLKSVGKSGYNITESELYCSNSLILIYLFLYLDLFCIFGDKVIGFDQTVAFTNVFVFVF